MTSYAGPQLGPHRSLFSILPRSLHEASCFDKNKLTNATVGSGLSSTADSIDARGTSQRTKCAPLMVEMAKTI
jgi:hypothetical protein